MNKTIVQFDLIKLSEESYCVDPYSLYVFGFINYNLLKDLLTDLNYLTEMKVEILNIPKTISLKVWEDSDDFRTWLDFEILDDDFEVPLP